MSLVTIAQTTQNWTHGGATATLKVYPLQEFLPNGSTVIVPQGNVSRDSGSFSLSCTVSGTTITIPELATLHATTNSDKPNGTYIAYLFDADGEKHLFLSSFKLPAAPTSTTWAAIRTYNTVPTKLQGSANGVGTLNASGLQTASEVNTAQIASNLGTKLIPAGGTSGQVLAKNSNSDYDTEWVDQSGGGGGGGGLDNVVEDTTPQLGGNLDLNGFNVGSASAADLTKLSELTATSTELNRVDGVGSQLAGNSDTATLTNKTISLGSNTVSGTTAQFNSALSDGDFATLAGSETLTNKTVSLGSNTVSGTTAQFNSALSDGDFATLAGSETLTNKTLTSPVISTISNTGTVTLPTATDTLVARGTTDTLTNKTIALGSNTVSGTTAQFNSANTDGDFATLAGSETLTNKTLTSPTINTPTGIVKGDVGLGNVANVNTTPAGVLMIIDGGGSAITTGVKGDLVIPFAGTITGWTILADQSGSIVVDVWKDVYGSFPPTVADTIAGSEKPTLSSASKNQDASLSTWTTSVSAGDILRFNVDSASTVTRVTLILNITKT